MRLQFVLSEMAIGLRRNITMTVAVVLTIAMSLAAIGVALLIRQQASLTRNFWFGSVEVSVYLSPDITPAQQQTIDDTLTGLPQVAYVKYVSKDQAWERFKVQFADQPDMIKNTPRDVLPPSYEVKLHDPKQFAVVASAVKLLPGVDQVADPADVFGQIFKFGDGLQQKALIIAAIVLSAAILLIYNTVRLSAYSRRRETGIMRLVGASDIYIQGPFVLEGVVAGLLGGLMSLGALAMFKQVIIDSGFRNFLPNISPYIGWHQVWVTGIWMIVLGAVLSAIVSAVSLQRYLRV